MNNYNDLILKKPVKYGKITLTQSRIKGDYHMFTGLKNQLELQDSLITNILPQDNELVKNINRSALMMLKIVNNLLDMARIESEYINLNYEWCDIEDIIGVAIKEVENIEERKLEIKIGENVPLV